MSEQVEKTFEEKKAILEADGYVYQGVKNGKHLFTKESTVSERDRSLTIHYASKTIDVITGGEGYLAPNTGNRVN